MQYQAKPVVVDAYEIKAVGSVNADGNLFVTVENAEGQQLIDAGMRARYHPVVGDFLVIQSDGYEYINPRDVFLRKYELLIAS